jgi:hypothetical protein
MLLYLRFLKSFFLSSFYVVMNDFRYYYLSVSLYAFDISVVILKNNLRNKIIYVLNLSNTLYIKFFLYLPLNYLKILPNTIY